MMIMRLVADTLLQFRAYLERSGLAQNTVDAYLRDMEGFSSWLGGGQREPVWASEFTLGDVEGYKRYLVEIRRQSPASVNRWLQGLRKFERFAVDRGIRETSPARQARPLAGSAPSSTRTLTQQQIAELFEAARARPTRTAVRDYTVVQLLVQTGVRISELVRLQVEDVCLTTGGGALVVRDAVGQPGRRLPLNGALQCALRAYLSQPRPAQASYLFLGRSSGPLSVRSVQQLVADVGRAAGLDISARTLRDTYARSLWRTTGDLNLLAEHLGHKRLEAALRHISPSAVDDGGS